MYVAVLLVAGPLIGPNSCNASAAQAPDVGGVLRAVARNYCLKGKPADPFLNPKVARINDSPSLRDELLTFFGDASAVDAYFRLNTETAVLPEHLDYSCFQLADHGSWALSIPAFSKSGDTAFVYVEYNCQALCGHGEMYILKRMSARWKVTQVYKMWVS
jgi:hypothetical protein